MSHRGFLPAFVQKSSAGNISLSVIGFLPAGEWNLRLRVDELNIEYSAESVEVRFAELLSVHPLDSTEIVRARLPVPRDFLHNTLTQVFSGAAEGLLFQQEYLPLGGNSSDFEIMAPRSDSKIVGFFLRVEAEDVVSLAYVKYQGVPEGEGQGNALKFDLASSNGGKNR